MQRIIFSGVCCLMLSSKLWAGKLDIDYIKPSPTKAFMSSLIIPGGGYFYIAPYATEKTTYELKGIILLLCEVGFYLYIEKRTEKADSLEKFMLISGFVGIRLLEFDRVIDDAEKERFKNMKKLFSEKTE